MNTLQSVFIREEVVKAIRAFFEEQHFHEVIAPVVNRTVPLEPTVYTFSTEWLVSSPPQKLFLTTSPERSIKKMLARGIGNCYSIGKCFRNLEGSGSRHNPEFLMLEWYREDADYFQIIRDTEALVLFVKQRVDAFMRRKKTTTLQYLGQEYELKAGWPILSLEKLFHEHTGLEMREVMSDEGLFAAAKQKGYQVENATWEQVFNQILLNEVELHFPNDPFFLIDFPARISPLCVVNASKPYLAERFEFFIGGMEIGNGNNENTNRRQVEQYFKDERVRRQKELAEVQPVDEEFLDSLDKMSSKKYAGIGLGVDRLAMLMADTAEIKDVEPFCV